MPVRKSTRLKKAAVRINQHESIPLFLLSMTGRELLSIAGVSRVGRDDNGQLVGYQRPEVRQHINEIVSYLNSDGVLFPNAIIVALSPVVRFLRSDDDPADTHARSGILEIPVPGAGRPLPGWIVDGQQRTMALTRSDRLDFPVPVSAFIAQDLDIQRDQFLRVNTTRPLPRGLITELLPQVETTLTNPLQNRRLASIVCERLASNLGSPFRRLIRRPSMSGDRQTRAVITDTSIVSMVEDSLNSPSGCLFPYRNLATGEADVDGMLQVLNCYWSAVRDVFPDAWGKPPTRSRLMHGAGIRAMGRLMDRIMPAIPTLGDAAPSLVQSELALVAPDCRWTSGHWDELGDLEWNEIQNTPRHIKLLSEHLLRKYLWAKGHRA